MKHNDEPAPQETHARVASSEVLVELEKMKFQTMICVAVSLMSVVIAIIAVNRSPPQTTNVVADKELPKRLETPEIFLEKGDYNMWITARGIQCTHKNKTVWEIAAAPDAHISLFEEGKELSSLTSRNLTLFDKDKPRLVLGSTNTTDTRSGTTFIGGPGDVTIFDADGHVLKKLP